jgi:hypothetical protein
MAELSHLLVRLSDQLGGARRSRANAASAMRACAVRSRARLDVQTAMQTRRSADVPPQGDEPALERRPQQPVDDGVLLG